ncbi:DUF1343 domain-containing protein [Tamlana sp. 62-3]|uniref:DUF1343 domain-containing protein n=1 Tax=Neotamlana sargassicola TaxID=2883125 RepID=A0A9X1I828_9FLAO|nr:DUF1343 domain-containing protein [Tamlana sargassicola]MCB4808059.1 DUF1343 domain-containing protein [Tamlana sargassicola]
MKVQTGLEVLLNDKEIQKQFNGNVALLCHNASIDDTYTHAALKFKTVFGDRFVKLFGPQHGFSTDVQDNMVETDHVMHPFFKIPVYSLYSETRIPTDEMLSVIDHLFVDLQDVGCRVYTYIYTLTHLLEKCASKPIEIVVLDRPNPLNGVELEGNILEAGFESFVGRHPIPMRHGMTMGEVALMHQKFWATEKANVKVIKMKNWERGMYFEDTKLPWLLPSPNLSRIESAYTFPATVMFEGTTLSEGRGTTQALEVVGHPKIEPYAFYEEVLSPAKKESELTGFEFRPITFLPTFQKHGNSVCGGVQIHVTDKSTYKPWRVGQLLMQKLYHYLGDDFGWKEPPYEYVFDQKPIDIINGSEKIRHWIVNNDSIDKLNTLEDLEVYKSQLKEIIIY